MSFLDISKASYKGAYENNVNGFNKGVGKDMFTPIWSNPPRRSTSQWLDLMQKSPRTDPMHKIASDVSITPYKLFVKYTDPKQEIKKHISLELLEKPCPDKTITKSKLFYLTMMYILSPAGECGWLLEKNLLGTPTEIYIVPPNWIVQTPTKSIPYFRILPQGNTSYQMVYVDPEDFIWFKDPDLLSPYGRGRGRSEGIGDEIEIDEYQSKWQKTFYFNNAVPQYVGMMPGADQPTIDRTNEKWNDEFGGYRNGHKTKFLNWDAKFQKLSENGQEMDFINSRKFLRDTCLQHYNMSGELFGILENANRSTIDLAYELYAKNTLSIQLKGFDDTLNRQFFPLFDEKLYIEHENVIPTDKEYSLKQSESGLKNGGLLVDEWRLANGRPPLPNGKGRVLYTPLNMMPTNIDSEDIVSNSPTTQDEPGKSIIRIKRKMSEPQRVAIWKSMDKAAMKYEGKLTKDLKKYFQSQQNKINDALEEMDPKGLSDYHSILKNIELYTELEIIEATRTGQRMKAVDDSADNLINWDEEIKLLMASMKTYWLLSAEEGFNNITNLYSLDLDFSIVKPEMLDWIKTNGLNHIKDITDTTKESLRKSLSEGLSGGESLAKLRDRVSDVYGVAKTSRATTIARTETMASLNVGNFKTIQKAGFEKGEWLTSKDGRVRESHADLDGEIREVGKEFSNGLMYPHDSSGDASEVCNCRCTYIVNVDDEENEE